MYIYTHMHTFMYICIYIYGTYIHRERDRQTHHELHDRPKGDEEVHAHAPAYYTII